LSEVPYTRIDYLEVSRHYATLVVSPIANKYQVWMHDTLTHADPIGLLFYIEDGSMEDDMDYKDFATSLGVPVPYVIGFDIAWEGDDIEENLVAAGLGERYGFDAQDLDLWLGATDGAVCRQNILLESRR
jgi:hypothetical protein